MQVVVILFSMNRKPESVMQTTMENGIINNYEPSREVENRFRFFSCGYHPKGGIHPYLSQLLSL